MLVAKGETTTMKNLKNITILFVLAAFLAGAASAQTVLSSTTLGAAITTLNGTNVTLAATTGMSSAGPANQINTVLYIDKEFFWVRTLVDSTHVVVDRNKGIGASARPALHANAAKVWYANTTTYSPNFVINAAQYFKNGNSEVSAACTRTSEMVVPLIYLFSGNFYDCLGGIYTQTDRPGTPVLGADVASATSITPTGTVFHVTGNTAIATIAVPAGWTAGMSLYIIPDGVIATTTAGNIAIISTSVVNRTWIFTWSGSKWVPSYIS